MKVVRPAVIRYSVLFGAVLVMSGAYLITLCKRRQKINVEGGKLAPILIIIAASVIPIVLIGIFSFEEKLDRLQWIGLVVIVLELAALATN